MTKFYYILRNKKQWKRELSRISRNEQQVMRRISMFSRDEMGIFKRLQALQDHSIRPTKRFLGLPEDWAIIRKQILERDGHKCIWCGCTIWPEVDHIIRRADGGTEDPENLRTLCVHCHARRHPENAWLQAKAARAPRCEGGVEVQRPTHAPRRRKVVTKLTSELREWMERKSVHRSVAREWRMEQ